MEFGLLIPDGKETKFKQKYYSVLVNIPSQMRSKVSGTRKQFHFCNNIKGLFHHISLSALQAIQTIDLELFSYLSSSRQPYARSQYYITMVNLADLYWLYVLCDSQLTCQSVSACPTF